MNKQFVAFGFFIFSFISSISSLYGQTIGIFRNSQISQLEFAANDIKTAFELKGWDVELLDIQKLSSDYKNQKVVILLESDKVGLDLLQKEAGGSIEKLGEQSFTIRTTGGNKKIYWIVGGDNNGAMYGGLQLAENVNLYGAEKTFNDVQHPNMLKRGIKWNIPFDKRSPTYYNNGFSENDFRGTSTKMAIGHVWSLNFWSKMFDELARDRYNVISLWSLHPFTSMIHMPEYPDVAIQNIEGFDGFSKTMSIDEKILFWKKVMTLAKNRGFEFYIYNWNIYTYGATGKYGIDNDPTNPNTIAYMRKCMTKLLETYPDLTGFGITAGENMVPLNNKEEADWTWATYGQGVLDFAKTHPERKVTFIHRYHDAGGAEVATNFKKLLDLPNVQFDFSFKYAVAHIYSATKPEWILTRNGDVPEQLIDLKLKTWIELRNDSFYYLHWGNPDFVKEYLGGIPEKERTFRGFMMGSDGYTPTYVFSSKANWAKDKLEIQRIWYTWMLWGRLGYNPNLSDTFFQDVMKFKYPQIESERLFNAWSNASKGIPMFTEVIQGTLISDFKWYPEACMSQNNGFVTIEQMAAAVPPPGSNVCSIAYTAAVFNGCENKKSAFDVADEIEKYASKALKSIVGLRPNLDTELGTNVSNIKAMSYLSLYFAEKLRASIFNIASKSLQAKEAMEKAVGYWMQYSAIMDTMYWGQDLQRTLPISDFKSLNANVMDEYIKLGGKPEDLDSIKGN